MPGMGVGVGEGISGWNRGVTTMKVGERRPPLLPLDHGSGARGAERAVPLNATLRFDVELHELSRPPRGR